MKNLWMILSLALLLPLAACGDEDSDTPAPGEEEESVEEEGCEHMAEGPATAVTAAADAASAPDATAEHTRVDIALAGVEGGNGGFVIYEAEADGEYIFFLDKTVGLTITDAAGNAVEIEESGPVDLCSEVAIHHVVDMGLGLHTIAFEATAETSLSMVVEAAGEHEEHEDE